MTLSFKALAKYRFVSKRLAGAMVQNPKTAWVMYYAYGISSAKAEAEQVTEIEGNLYLFGTPIQSLGNLESVGGDLYLQGTPIKDLGNLQSVGGSLSLYGTPIKDLGNLKSVGLNLYLEGTRIIGIDRVKVKGEVIR